MTGNRLTARRRPAAYQGGICFITDRVLCPLTCLEMARLVLKAGVRWIQYRDKERDRLRLYRTALALRELTATYGACLIVNDFADIAAAVGADGVHLGQDDLPLKEARKILGKGRIIGISTHSLEEALLAEADGADYVGFGPVYATATKKAGRPRGVGRLREVGGKLRIPVVAIGGIERRRLPDVMGSGAKAVAVASSILGKGDISRNAESFLTGLQRCGCRVQGRMRPT